MDFEETKEEFQFLNSHYSPIVIDSNRLHLLKNSTVIDKVPIITGNQPSQQ